MSDPLSLISIGAAVGGLAGKVAEKTWDSGERWLRERFGSHSHKVQERARLNVLRFVEQLAARVQALEDKHEIKVRTLSEQESHPQFSVLLQRTLLNAAQTEDETKQAMLALLVATRLNSKAETTFALASQLASDAIASSTHGQLELLGLSCFLEEMRPNLPIAVADYRRWLELFLEPFADFEFREIDAQHLVAIACVTYDRASGRDLSILLQMKGGEGCIGESFDDLPVAEDLQFQWTEGLAGVFLTSVGSIVGGIPFDQITGRNSGLPSWH